MWIYPSVWLKDSEGSSNKEQDHFNLLPANQSSIHAIQISERKGIGRGTKSRSVKVGSKILGGGKRLGDANVLEPGNQIWG